MSQDRISEYLSQFSQTRSVMIDQLRRVVVGQAEVIEQILGAIFTRGHCLLVGVPGLAKTLMVSSISQILDVAFKRIQFTPDLMPSDITGTTVLDEQEGGRRNFRFVHGPIFANIILADEINRTTPKTQSALLEAMNENQVTIENVTYALPRPFMVLATQNPIEHHGTYPLPESQLDRFLMRIEVGYPDPAAEKEILKRFSNGNHHYAAETVLDPTEVVLLQEQSRKVHIDDSIVDYMIHIVNRTREHPEIELGISPRGTAALFRATQALAMIDGRSFALPDDVKKLAHPIFEHRLVLARSGARLRTGAKRVLAEIVDQVPVPA